MIRNTRKNKRQVRTRKKIEGTTERPRLSVFRSNKYIYAQLIDDKGHKTLLGLSEKKLDDLKGKQRLEKAHLLGQKLAKIALDKKIKKIIFDRGCYAYHGRVKKVAEGAREGGLKF